MTLFPEDPRSYIRQEYERRHKRNPAYSWRSFARDLKLSPSMLSEFLKGRYGLSRGKASVVAETIKLDSAHTEHFIDLLEAGFHRLPAQRELARLRVDERLQNAGTSISIDSLRHIMDWTYFAMLEVIGIEKGNIGKLENWIRPFRFCADKAHDTVQTLLELNLLQQDSNGLRASEDITIAGERVSDEDTRALHLQVTDLTKLALQELGPDQRESVSVFASVREEDFCNLRKELNDNFLQVLNKYANRDDANAVVCLSLQAFPIYQLPPNDGHFSTSTAE